MSLLVAMSIFEIEQDLLLNNDFANGGACLLKLLQSHSSDSSVNRNEFLDLTTPLLVEESDEIYEILTAATPKRFSNMVKTNSASGYVKLQKQNPRNLLVRDQLKIMYRGRDILDLAANIRQREFVQPSRGPTLQLSRDTFQQQTIYKCTDEDCQFIFYHFD